MCVNDKHVTLHQVVKELGDAWLNCKTKNLIKKIHRLVKRAP